MSTLTSKIFRLCSIVFLLSFWMAYSLQAQSPGGKQYRYTILFNTALWEPEAKVRNAFMAFIDSVKSIHGNAAFDVQLTGYTDSVGAGTYNLQLSEKRTLTVEALLKSSGLNIGQIQTQHLGESRPRSASDLARNRRVELVLTLPEKTADENKEKIRDLYLQTQSLLQRFNVYTKRDTFLISRNNTWITIKAGTFTGVDTVEFRLKEALTLADMVSEDLTTTANGKMLETGGMFYTEAVKPRTNQPVLLKKNIQVLLPTDTLRKDMQLFSGRRHSIEEIVNWAQDKNPLFRQIGCWSPQMCGPEWRRLDLFRSCDRCRFFCRLKRFPKPFVGMFDRSVRADNRYLRHCQRLYRQERRGKNKGRNAAPDNQNNNQLNPCEALDMAMQRYQVDNYQELVLKMNQRLLDSFKVSTLEDLNDTLEKIYALRAAEEEKNFIRTFERGKTYDLQSMYRYAFEIRKLGWTNIDAFPNIENIAKTDMKVMAEVGMDTDCLIVFPKRRSLLKAEPQKDHYVFKDLPKGEDAYLVVLKIKKAKPFLYLEPIKVQGRIDAAEPVAVSLSSLKKKLAVLDL